MPEPKQINHVTVLVTDKERAKEFYCGILGFQEYSFGEGGKHLWVRAGTQYVHLSNNSGPPVTGNFYHFAVGFEDFRNLLDELVAKGVDVFDLDENIAEVSVNQNFDEQVRQFFVRDPDGNLVEIFDINSKYFNPEF